MQKLEAQERTRRPSLQLEYWALPTTCPNLHPIGWLWLAAGGANGYAAHDVSSSHRLQVGSADFFQEPPSSKPSETGMVLSPDHPFLSGLCQDSVLFHHSSLTSVSVWYCPPRFQWTLETRLVLWEKVTKVTSPVCRKLMQRGRVLDKERD
jgi:hypothetical protein